VAHDAVAGEAVAGDLELDVSAAVVLEAAPGLVGVPAVDLDHQVVRGPIGVDEDAFDELVQQRGGQARLSR
jgi:hypothetical protein